MRRKEDCGLTKNGKGKEREVGSPHNVITGVIPFPG
jgi:hypothetical protein